MKVARNPGLAAALVLQVLLGFTAPAGSLKANGTWLSPSAVVAAPDGKTLFVACATAGRVLVLDVGTRRVTQSVSVPNQPTGLTTADGRTLFVTCGVAANQVCVLDVAKGRISARWPAGYGVCAPVVSPDGKTLFVCNRFDNNVSMFDLGTGKEVRRIAVRREPVAAAVTLDGKRLLVANHLPTGRADVEHVGAVVSVIDTASGQVIDDLWLPDGSVSLSDLRISPDGKYAVVTHILARFRVPTTHLERGWMNTNAKTIIALDRMQVLNTVLLDNIDSGAANPWGAAWSADGKKLVVALAGTHEVSVTDFPALLEKLARLESAAPAPVSGGWSANTGVSAATAVPQDLSMLVGLRERRRLPEGDLGPRGVVVAGGVAYTANYFSDSLTAIELEGPHPKMETIPLGPKPRLTAARRGELAFNDARLCFQGWQSCASCHPGEARTDGLNWDLLNDGLGNPKNNKSLLLVFQTPPAMSTGVRESAEAAVSAGLRNILFTVPPPGLAEDIGAYLKSLQPVPSPHLVKGKLSPAARRGQQLFRSKEVGCAQCHPEPLFTDLKSYDVGTRASTDYDTGTFDTPTLVELWRTAPYLHDGSAATVHDVLVEANPNDRHGHTSQLTAGQINDLVAYLLSL